jgi:serine/threonine-protein kinase
MRSQWLISTVPVAVVTAATFMILQLMVAPRLPVKQSPVPQVNGLTAEQARALLLPNGLLLYIEGEKPDEKERATPGTLFEQRPLVGSIVKRGTEVHAWVAGTPPAQHVPVLAGKTLDEARELLTHAHLRPGLVMNSPSETVVKGEIISSTPAAGAEAPPDSSVDLTISSGADATQVPSVVGKTESRAKEALTQAGFAVGSTRTGSNDDMDPGLVIKQTPAAGATAPHGAKIDLVINE